MEMHDAWFFIGVFVFIFLVWVSVGGPTHPISFAGPRLALPGALGGGTYLQLPHSPFGIGDSSVSLTNPSGGSGVSSASDVPPPSALSGVGFGPVSPYRGALSMSHYVSNASSTDEYIQISVPQNAGTPVDISSWTIGSAATGKSALIPLGTAVPTSGVVNAVHDIVLQPGDSAYIISGKSPVGSSFRENKCIGYFGAFQTFSPSLPQNCPTPSNELSTYYGKAYIHDPNCIDYVDTLNRCQTPLTKTPVFKLSDTCQSFLVKYLNYNGCINTHGADTDFNGTLWHIYLGRTKALWRTKHEVVKLLDINNKTVDAFSY